MIATRMLCAALALCLSLVGVERLLAEEPKTKPESAPSSVPEGGKLTGILTHFEYNWTKVHNPKPDLRVSLKAEGETEPVDYVLALQERAVEPKLEESLKKVFPSNTVNLEWEMREGKRLVTKISVLTPTGGQGTLVGTVMARDKGSLDLKGGDRRAVTTRYVVGWDPVAKGPSPALATALEGLNVGDKVKIVWSANPERLWLNQVQLVAKAGANKASGSKKPGSPK